MGRLALGVSGISAGLKAVMCAAGQVPAIFGAEVVWWATRLAVLHERKLSSSY